MQRFLTMVASSVRRGGKMKNAKGKGKKGGKGKKEMYDLIVNIDLAEWRLTVEQVRILFYSFYYYLFCILVYFFLPLPPLRGQPAVIMPTLLAPQQGMTCPCRLERCWI